MAYSRLPHSLLPPVDEATDVARLFRHASHPTRLNLLHALVQGERSVSVLTQLLGQASSCHLRILVRARIIKRWFQGGQPMCCLTGLGLRLIDAYNAAAGIDLELAQPALKDPSEARPQSSPKSPHLVNAAYLLNHAGNPLRLQMLFMLSEGNRTAQDIAAELTEYKPTNIATHLRHLRDGSLVESHKVGHPKLYTITDGGLSIVHVIRATTSRVAVRQGTLSLVADPLAAEEDMSDANSPERLACLLKSFADPLRLRVLNLLGGGKGVCVCHLSDILEMTTHTMRMSLRYCIDNRTILEEWEGNWLKYRLSRPALNLYHSLMGAFGPRLSNAELLLADRERLARLSPCVVQLEVESHSSKDSHRGTRTA